MTQSGRRTMTAGLGTAALLMLAGCETTVRENIISSVETGIGLTLAQNPKTEMYEAKIGYIRSQFYSVPTGKVVANEEHDDDADGNNASREKRKDMRSNRADITPNVVSGIRMHSGIDNLLLGLDVCENFAVGDIAVQSDAATAMYIANAKQPTQAGEAAAAVKARTDYQTKVENSFLKGKQLKPTADGLVDGITTAEQFNAALQAGLQTRILDTENAESLSAAADKDLGKAKNELKTFLRASSAGRVERLEQFIGKLQEITKSAP